MSMEENECIIREFRQYFYDNLDNIDKIDVENSKLFQKILYITFLDSLSASFYPNTSNKKRFIQLIDNFSDWKNKDRICTTYLMKKLEQNSSLGNQEVRKILKDKIIFWERRSRHYICIEEDFWVDDLREYFRDGTFQLRNYKYSSLLYEVRNVLVHQHQSKNEFGDKHPEEPFYEKYNIINFETKKLKFEKFELIFPNIFLKNLCKTTLDNFLVYCQKENVNPFPKYYAGDYFLKELNKKY